MSYGHGDPSDRNYPPGGNPVNPNAPGSAGPGGAGPPYGPNRGGWVPPPSSGNNVLWIVLGVIAVIVLGGGLVCCGFGYFGWQFMQTELANQFRPQIEDSPEIVEHIGEIQEMQMDFRAMQRPETQGNMVFTIQGSKGSGTLIVDPEGIAEEETEGYILVLPDGRRIPLTGVREDFDFDVDIDPGMEPEPEAEPQDADPPPQTVPDDSAETNADTDPDR